MFEERSQRVGTGEEPWCWLRKEHPRQRSTNVGGQSMLGTSIQRTQKRTMTEVGKESRGQRVRGVLGPRWRGVEIIAKT